MHADLPDSGQSDRAWAVVVADPDRRRAAFGMFVAQPKRRCHAGFFLEAREADSLSCALAGARVRPGGQRPAAVHGGFLEHLLAHLRAPGQAGHHDLGFAGRVDGHHPAGVLGFLPRVKPIDQVKPAPRDLHSWIGLALGECGFHHLQALIETKPGRAGMPGQHLVLLDSGVEAELERGVPAHHR